MVKVLKRLNKTEVLRFFIGLIFIVAQVWLELKLPDFMSGITTLTQTQGSMMSEILRIGGLMLLCALGSLIAAIVVGFFAARIGASFSQRLRSMLFNKVDSFSSEEINRFSTASLITRSTNDVMQIRMVLTIGMQVAVRAPIMAVIAVTKIAGKGFEWTIVTASAVLILVAVFTLMMIFVMPKFKKMQTLTDNLNGVTRENLTGLRVVRAYNAEAYQEEKFEEANKALTDTQLFTSRGMAMMMPIVSTMVSGLSLAIYWIGAYMIHAAQMSDKLPLFSDMVVFTSYAMQIVMAFMLMVMVFIQLPRASVSANRINEVLETEPTVLDGHLDMNPSSRIAGEIRFDKVYFKYPDSSEYVLHDISFTAQQGETVAFIGSTGSGKSTLINLIPRFYDPTEGTILINGVNIRDYKLETLRNKLGYVPQKPVLFRGTVGSNVAYGDNGQAEATEEDIGKSLRIAQGVDFVEKMEGQCDANVAQGGANLSGGQKQRLAIARAVCRKPEIYLLDDSFSALDYKTDRMLRSALKKETANVTCLIVAQRIGTIIDADRIIVLDQGRIVGAGKHRELLQSCEVYREIAVSQLSEKELVS